MKLQFNLLVLMTIFDFISYANLLLSDTPINTVEDFLDTLINSSRYDRRIRPFSEQRRKYSIVH